MDVTPFNPCWTFSRDTHQISHLLDSDEQPELSAQELFLPELSKPAEPMELFELLLTEGRSNPEEVSCPEEGDDGNKPICLDELEARQMGEAIGAIGKQKRIKKLKKDPIFVGEGVSAKKKGRPGRPCKSQPPPLTSQPPLLQKIFQGQTNSQEPAPEPQALMQLPVSCLDYNYQCLLDLA